MTRPGRGAAGGMLGVALLLGAADCESGPPAVPPEFFAELHATLDHNRDRSQPVVPFWAGPGSLIQISMVEPVSVSALVTDEEDPNRVFEDTCIFLDGPGELVDTSKTAESNGDFTQLLVPTAETYEVLVAPDCFLQSSPVLQIPDGIVVSSNTSENGPFEWVLPVRDPVEGVVEYGNTGVVAGAVVTVFTSAGGGEPSIFTGVRALTNEFGEFSFDVPEGTYDLVVSSPADGSVPIPPIRIDNELLPPLNGLRTLISYPEIPTVLLQGTVLNPQGESYAAGRVLIEGYVGEPAGSGGQFTGGWFRAELETNPQGGFQLEVPRVPPGPGSTASYTITVYPDLEHISRYDVARRTVELPGNSSEIQNIELRLSPPRNTRIEVFRYSSEERITDAQLRLRMLDQPHYSFSRSIPDGAPDAFVGELPSSRYDVEVILPDDPETGARQSRTHGMLDLTAGDAILQIYVADSEAFGGYVVGPGGGVGSIGVVVKNPSTGKLLDSTVTRGGDQDTSGYFEAVLPVP